MPWHRCSISTASREYYKQSIEIGSQPQWLAYGSLTGIKSSDNTTF